MNEPVKIDNHLGSFEQFYAWFVFFKGETKSIASLIGFICCSALMTISEDKLVFVFLLLFFGIWWIWYTLVAFILLIYLKNSKNRQIEFLDDKIIVSSGIVSKIMMIIPRFSIIKVQEKGKYICMTTKELGFFISTKSLNLEQIDFVKEYLNEAVKMKEEKRPPKPPPPPPKNLSPSQ